MSTTPDSRKLESFEPQHLGEMLRHMRDDNLEYKDKPFVTLLVGAGFSVSAGVPAASTIVAELRGPDEKHPYLVHAGATPTGRSDYAFLMEKLGSPKARADRIRGYVNRARDSEGRLKVNWAHLLLATLVKHGYIRRILTTNFDPLIVEALAMMGQPIRTFDLNSNGHFYPGTLDDATVIYLHGQMHSLFLANSPEELHRLKELYPPALQEAVQDSVLIVVGYSGDCDPVLDALTTLPSFPLGLYWSQYSRDELRPGVKQVFQDHGANCKLCQGLGADEFMVQMVNHGMKLSLPDEVLRPFAAARNMLERITAFPVDDHFKSDITQKAIDLLKRAETSHNSNADSTTSAGTAPPGHSEQTAEDGSLALLLKMAAINRDWQRFDELRKGIEPNPEQWLSQVVGEGLLVRSSSEIDSGNSQSALTWLTEANKFGVPFEAKGWLLVLRAAAIIAEAKNQKNLALANRLFGEALEKYEEAVRIKPDMHEAFNNWGIALSVWAKLQENTPAAERLYAQATEKYAEAVRIKPDKHEAFYNWGSALDDWAKREGNTPGAERLYAQAAEKYAEAVRIKPDDHKAFNNWGYILICWARLHENTPDADRLLSQADEKCAEAARLKPDDDDVWFNWACVFALRGNVVETVSKLKKWHQFASHASRTMIENDSNFDRVRNLPEFQAFLATLPREEAVDSRQSPEGDATTPQAPQT